MKVRRDMLGGALVAVQESRKDIRRQDRLWFWQILSVFALFLFLFAARFYAEATSPDSFETVAAVLLASASGGLFVVLQFRMDRPIRLASNHHSTVEQKAKLARRASRGRASLRTHREIS